VTPQQADAMTAQHLNYHVEFTEQRWEALWPSEKILLI